MIAWIKRRWQWVVGALLFVLGAGWLWSRRKQLSAEARARIWELRSILASKKDLRDYLLKETEKDDRAIAQLDEQIEASETELLAHHETVEGLTRGQIRERLARLGYD